MNELHSIQWWADCCRSGGTPLLIGLLGSLLEAAPEAAGQFFAACLDPRPLADARGSVPCSLDPGPRTLIGGAA